MTTRRAFIAAALLLGTAAITGLADPAPLQVTYYYLPG